MVKLHTFIDETKFEYRGKQLTASVSISVYHDECLTHEIEDLNKETLEKLDDGRLIQVSVVVEAFLNQVHGTDSLGGVFLESGDRHSIKTQVKEVVKEHGMLNEALFELTEKLNELMKVLGE